MLTFSFFGTTLPVLRSLLAAAASLTLSQAALAQAPAPVQLQQPDATSLRLRIANPQQLPGQVKVVRRASGQVLYQVPLAAASYGHRFNFGQLPDGLYTLALQLGTARYRYTVEVQQHGTQAAVRELVARQTTPALLAARAE